MRREGGWAKGKKEKRMSQLFMALARQICAIGGFVIDSCPLYSHKGTISYTIKIISYYATHYASPFNTSSTHGPLGTIPLLKCKGCELKPSENASTSIG